MFGLRHRGSSTTGLDDLQVDFNLTAENFSSHMESFQPIAPVKGATLVEEEFMEEEKVKSEIYVYYMKTVGKFN